MCVISVNKKYFQPISETFTGYKVFYVSSGNIYDWNTRSHLYALDYEYDSKVTALRLNYYSYGKNPFYIQAFHIFKSVGQCMTFLNYHYPLNIPECVVFHKYHKIYKVSYRDIVADCEEEAVGSIDVALRMKILGEMK